MNEYLREIVSQHPLYLATCKCVEDELEMYDYHDFFPGWGMTTVNYRMIIQELFQVERLEFEDFTRHSKYQYQSFVIELRKGYLRQVKRLFRLVLSLPMCEYEIENSGGSSNSHKQGTSNNYVKQFPYFKCNTNYITEMSVEEVGSTMKEFFLRTENTDLLEAVTNFAFNRYKLISPSGSLEDRYKLAFRDYLITPICSLLGWMTTSQKSLPQYQYHYFNQTMSLILHIGCNIQ